MRRQLSERSLLRGRGSKRGGQALVQKHTGGEGVTPHGGSALAGSLGTGVGDRAGRCTGTPTWRCGAEPWCPE